MRTLADKQTIWTQTRNVYNTGYLTYVDSQFLSEQTL